MSATSTETRSTTVAMPVWEGRVSPVFDVARHLLLVDLEEGGAARRHHLAVGPAAHRDWGSVLRAQGVDVLICGAISDELAASLGRRGVGVIPWIKGEADRVLEAYLSGRLDDPRFVVPGKVRPPEPA